MPVVKTACTYDCPDACGLLAELRDGRLRLRGDPDHPITRGLLCPRVRRHPDRLRSPDRLTAPLARCGGAFSPIGWDEALELAASRLGAALSGPGPASVVLLTGGGSLGLSKALVSHFFCSLGPVTTLSGGACGEAGEAAQTLDFGDAASHDYTDLAHSAAVVLWGKNPAATGLHLLPFLEDARRRGVEVVLVECRPTETTPHADRVVTVAPSGDGALALAVVRRLADAGRLAPEGIARAEGWDDFRTWISAPERSADRLAAAAGVSVGEVDLLADLYADRRPVATWIGWGLQRRGSGGLAVRAIDALALLTGNVGVPGGGASFTSRRRRGLDLSGLARPSGRTIPACGLGRALASLADPPASFVYVAGANPVTSLADSASTARALRSTGFVVVADAFPTDTAEAADLVLPVWQMLEEDDVVGSYQHHHVAVARRAVDPPEGSRADWWIVRELGRRLGLPPDPLLEDPDAALARMTAPWFEGREPAVGRNPSQQPVPFADRFPTATGKARLLRETPGSIPVAAGFPLTLLSASARGWQTSMLAEAAQRGPAACHVHPEAAAGLADGAAGRLVSPLGSMAVLVRHDPRLRLDVAVVHRGGWVRHGRGVNVLVEARQTDLGGGTAFYDQRARLEP